MQPPNIAQNLTITWGFVELAQRFHSVEGYLLPFEGYALNQLAALGRGVGEIVEIGSFKGRSTCFLAAGSKAAGREKVTAIDHFKGSPEHQPGQDFECKELIDIGSTFPTFQKNLQAADLWDHVTPLVMSTTEAAKSWNKPIRLLFIDGDHSYETSREDFEAFQEFVIAGGFICFHDINIYPGVTRFFEELMSSTTHYKSFCRAVTLAVIVKT